MKARDSKSQSKSKSNVSSTGSRNNVLLIGGIIGAVGIALVILLIFSSLGNTNSDNMRDLATERAQLLADQIATATAEADTLLSIADRIPGIVVTTTPISRDHNDDLRIPFGELPPNGGVHNSVWQNCRSYDDPVRPEHAVHSLEHGAVWITYQPGLAADQVDVLESYTGGGRFVLVSPFPNQRSPIVLTAWGYQLELDAADDSRVAEFVDTFDRGPQTPEPGATCSNGKNVADG